MYHPGGSIGKKLYMKVSDLYINNQVPSVQLHDDIKTVILEISSKRLGATAVFDKEKLVGMITDGDLRRMLERTTDIRQLTAHDIMTKNPKTIEPDTLVVNALNLMQNNNITQLLVLEDKKYLGVIHLHDILKEGII
jgi:arabinose-5-phosphate isomerase